jgi:hypothetical protein
MRDVVIEFLVAVAATVTGALTAQYLINNFRTVRRTVGGL